MQAERVAMGERLVLRPSARKKLRSLVFGLVCALVTSIGALGALEGDVAFGVLVALFGLPLSAYWLAAAMPRSGSLVLTREGFRARYCWINRSWDWDTISRFDSTISENEGAGVTRHVTFSTHRPDIPKTDRLHKLGVRGLSRVTQLPDTYGRRPDELAELMEFCRQRCSDRVDVPDAGGAADALRSRVLNWVALGIVVAVVGLTGVLWAIDPLD